MVIASVAAHEDAVNAIISKGEIEHCRQRFGEKTAACVGGVNGKEQLALPGRGV
ncbi:hypothetical protein D3C72_2451890 [compost metagenome]